MSVEEKLESFNLVRDEDTSQQEEVHFCRKCGKQIKHTTQFCRHCGAKLEKNPVAQEISNAQKPAPTGEAAFASIESSVAKSDDEQPRPTQNVRAVENNKSEADPEAIFARGLPEWDLLPPALVQRGRARRRQ